MLKKKIQTLLSLINLKNFTKAEIYNKKLLTEYPKEAYLYNSLGLVLTYLNRTDEALENFNKGLKIDPSYALIYNNMGTIFFNKKEYSKAENFYKKSCEFNNKLAEPRNNLGNLYIKLNDYKNAISSYEDAIKVNNKFYIAYYNLGLAYKHIGDFSNSLTNLNESIKINSKFLTAHRSISQLIKYTKENDHFKLLNEIYLNDKIKKEEKTELSFALGKAYDDIKDFDNAFKYFEEGNNQRRKTIKFSMNKEKEEFSKIKETFNSKLFHKFNNPINKDDSAIFVLGMPRSGTTLVEQILSSHNKVYGGDELNFIPNLINDYFGNVTQIANIREKDIKEISSKYVNLIKNISNNSSKITDKLPVNFKWIGFIKILLPNAKIIHCKRNAKDNCMSIFKNYFVNVKLDFAYKIDEIVSFYNLYSDLMNYWKKILPNAIIDIDYDKLVADPDKQIPQLIKSSGLDWDKKCMEFYKTNRPIKTASDTQARSKIYKTSLKSWENYKKYVDESFSKLNL